MYLGQQIFAVTEATVTLSLVNFVEGLSCVLLKQIKMMPQYHSCMQVLTVSLNAAKLHVCILKQNSRSRLYVHRRLSNTMSWCTILQRMPRPRLTGFDALNLFLKGSPSCLVVQIMDLSGERYSLLRAAYSSLDSRSLTMATKVSKSRHNSTKKHIDSKVYRIEL